MPKIQVRRVYTRGMLINGKWATAVAADDRGLQYGDGVFETLAVRGGAPVQWSRHLARLRRGCQCLGIPVPSERVLADEAARLCRGSGLAVLKIIVTRGPGGRGYRPPDRATPTRILALHAWPEHPQRYGREGIDLTICRTRLGSNPRLAGIKHLNRLEHVLARAEWDEEFQEGLMLDSGSRVIEGTMSNLFLIRGEALVTPDLGASGVLGVTRARIIEWARDHVRGAEVRPVALEELHGAEGLFVCNSIIGVWPVRSLEGRRFAIPPWIGTLGRFLESG